MQLFVYLSFCLLLLASGIHCNVERAGTDVIPSSIFTLVLDADYSTWNRDDFIDTVASVASM